MRHAHEEFHVHVVMSCQRGYRAVVQPTIVDAVVTRNNAAAAAIMAEHGVPTVDLHAAIVGQCGAPPNPTCFNHSQCFCPHCPGVGYQFLAEHVLVPAIRKLLPARREEGPAFLVEEGRQRVAPVS